MTSINWKRWLPSSAPLISGAIASGVVLLLRKLGIVVLPQEVTAAVTPAIAFLTAAIVHRPSEADVVNLVETESKTTLGKLLVSDIEKEIDSNPAIFAEVKQLALGILAGQEGKVVAVPVSSELLTGDVDQRKIANVVLARAADLDPPQESPPGPPADAVDEHGELAPSHFPWPPKT